MKNKLTLMIVGILMLALVGCGGQQAAKAPEAPKFPTKNVELIVPFAAGGGTDSAARALANSAKDKLGQSVVVVNKTGGGGAVGMNEGMKAKPDGYSVTMVTVELVTLKHLGLAQLDYQGFEPLIRVNMDPSAITVRSDAPWKTLKEFLDYAKANPGKVKVGNSGPGGIWHLAAASLEQKADVKFNHVPYSGGAAPAILALLGGNIDAVAVSPAEVDNNVRAGKLKVLAVASDKRVKTMPDVPTMKEAGTDVVLGTWRGLAVPKGTPAPFVERFSIAVANVLKQRVVYAQLTALGLTVGYMNPAQLAARESAYTGVWAGIIRRSGFQPQ